MTRRWAGDPRERADGLGWVTRAVFPDTRLRLQVTQPGADRTGAAEQALARYAVVPSAGRAKFLLPLASRPVTAASVLAYNALRPWEVRAGRAAIGLLARLGLLGLLRSPVLTVGGPAGADPGETLLSAHLADRLGAGRLHAAIGIRPPDPHHKPTLQLFDDAGRPRAYAKVGWNDATRSLVRAEAAALRELPRPGGNFPDLPRLMCVTEFGGRTIALVEPMPPAVRRIRHPARPLVAAMLAVARRGGPPAPPRLLRGSPFLRGLHARAVGADTAIHTAIAALAVRDGDLPLEFGDWHGDWVPWNLGRHQGRLLAWDWENRAPDVPVGFDFAHQAFQIALSTHRRPAAGAATTMVAALERHGAELGLAARQRRCVADAYLIELWLRTYELAGGGAGWNSRLHPALLHLLAGRLSGGDVR